MKKPTLPPRWIGAVLIIAGILGLTFTVHPGAAGIALAVVICAACLVAALGAMAACIAAERADEKMGVTEEAARESARLYADQLRAQYSMTENAAEIAARHFPARGSATEPKTKGGDRDSADTATPGAISVHPVTGDGSGASICGDVPRPLTARTPAMRGSKPWVNAISANSQDPKRPAN